MWNVSNYKEKPCLFNSDHLPLYVNEILAIFMPKIPIFSALLHQNRQRQMDAFTKM